MLARNHLSWKHYELTFLGNLRSPHFRHHKSDSETSENDSFGRAAAIALARSIRDVSSELASRRNLPAPPICWRSWSLMGPVHWWKIRKVRDNDSLQNSVSTADRMRGLSVPLCWWRCGIHILCLFGCCHSLHSHLTLYIGAEAFPVDIGES